MNKTQNREIKFRAYDKQPETFYYSEEIGLVGFFERVQINDDRVDQYTGLKDKDNKEIYEGDIVQPIGCADICSVEWEHDSWGFHSDDELFAGKDFEIIGNIYENPELIQKQKEK